MEYRKLYACDQMSGAILPSALVAINKTDGTAASLFNEAGLAIGNPVVAAETGLYGFAAANGDYEVIISVGGDQQPAFKVYLIDPADEATAVAAAQSTATAAQTEAAAASTAAASQPSEDLALTGMQHLLANAQAAVFALKSQIALAVQGALDATGKYWLINPANNLLPEGISLADRFSGFDSDFAGAEASIAELSATTGDSSAAFEAEIAVLTTDSSAQAAEIVGLQSDFDTSEATFIEEFDTQAGVNEATASEISVLQTSVAGNTSAITTEETERVDGDSTNAALITGLQSDFAEVSAGLSTEETTRATAVSALAAEQQTLVAQTGFNANMVAESTFDRGGVSWTISHGTTGGDPANGDYLIYPLASGALGTNHIILATQMITGFTAGKAYPMQARLYTGGLGPGGASFLRCLIDWQSASGSLGLADVGIQTHTAEGWTLFTLDDNNGGALIAPTGATQALLTIDLAASSGMLHGAGDNVAVGQIKIEQAPASPALCTRWSDSTSSSLLYASIVETQATEATDVDALAAETATLSANVDGLSADVDTQAAAITTLQEQTAYYLVEVTTSGGTASVKLVSASDAGTLIELLASFISFGPNGYFNETTNTLEFLSGGGDYKTVLGGDFGASSNLTLWYGPATVATSSATVANSIWAFEGGQVYHGGAAFNTPKSANGAGSTATIGSAWSTFAVANFPDIPTGSSWQSVGGSILNHAIGSNPFNTGSTGTVKWQIVEAPHGTTTYSSAIASGSFAGQYVSSEGVGFPNATDISNDYLFSSSLPVACVNSGNVDLVLQFMLATPSTMTSQSGSVGGTFGAAA